MIVVLAAAHLFQNAPTAADFFSLKPGMTRTCMDSGGNVVTEEVLEPITYDGKPALPLVQKAENKVIDRAYYRVEANTVYLLGYDDPKQWLSQPMPILKFDGHPGKPWNYDGFVPIGKSSVPIRLEGECRGVRMEDVFGVRVPVLEVRLKEIKGVGMTQEISEETDKYAVGSGVIEVTATVRAGKQRSHPVVTHLTRIEGVKTNG